MADRHVQEPVTTAVEAVDHPVRVVILLIKDQAVEAEAKTVGAVALTVRDKQAANYRVAAFHHTAVEVAAATMVAAADATSNHTE